MAGAKERVIQASQQQFQTVALQVIEKLDLTLDEFKIRVVNDLKMLSENPERIKDIVISDGDYEIKPPKPEIARKEKPAIEDIRQEAAG
jgi:uncharacterized ubiquitin-like protein YukD